MHEMKPLEMAAEFYWPPRPWAIFFTSVETADVFEECDFAHSRAVRSAFSKPCFSTDSHSLGTNDRTCVDLPMRWERPRIATEGASQPPRPPWHGKKRARR